MSKVCVLRSQRAGKKNLSSSSMSGDISSGVFIPVGCVTVSCAWDGMSDKESVKG